MAALRKLEPIYIGPRDQSTQKIGLHGLLGLQLTWILNPISRSMQESKVIMLAVHRRNKYLNSLMTDLTNGWLGRSIDSF